jgi:L-amino acid N-acyltransferase
MTMKIRPATVNDLPAILEIYNHAVIHSTATAEYNPQVLAMRQAWYDEHMNDTMPILVAENDAAEVVGWSSLSKFHPRYGYRFSSEDSVYIAEGWRGQGVGKQLVAPLITLARERGLHIILASIDSENEASIRLHKGLGFVQVGELKEVIYKFDRWLSTVFLQLTL